MAEPNKDSQDSASKKEDKPTNYKDLLPIIDLMDRTKATWRRWTLNIKSNPLLCLSGVTITATGWIAAILLSFIVGITIEKDYYIDNLINNITTVEAMSTELNVYTYSATYSSEKIQSVTLKLLTPNSRVWAIEGDCIRTMKKPLPVYSRTLLHENSTVQRFEAVFNKEGIPLYALAHSYLIYTITADSAAENKTGCVFLYFFNTKETIEDFLQSNDSSDQLDVQGYYNKSINCIKTDGVKHDAYFSLNVTGETFVGLLANVSTNITYTVRGTIVEYNTLNCQKENTHTLTYNKPLKIDICKSSFCAFKSNETMTIVIDSEEQGVHVHWEPEPLEFTLATWIIIILLGVLVILVGITIIIILIIIIIFCCYLECLKKGKNQNKNIQDQSTSPRTSSSRDKDKEHLLGHKGNNGSANGSDIEDNNKENKKQGATPLTKQDSNSEGDIEVKQIREVLYKVLHGCDHAMSTLFTNEIEKVANKMRKNQIITDDLHANPSYDAIILCFKGALSFMKTKEELEIHCSNFVKSINQVMEKVQDKEQQKKWEQLATAIKTGWETEIEVTFTIIIDN